MPFSRFRVRCLKPDQHIKTVFFRWLCTDGRERKSYLQWLTLPSSHHRIVSMYLSQVSQTHGFKIIYVSVSNEMWPPEVRRSWGHLGWRSLGQTRQKRRRFECTIIWGWVLNFHDLRDKDTQEEEFIDQINRIQLHCEARNPHFLFHSNACKLFAICGSVSQTLYGKVCMLSVSRFFNS